MKRLITILMLIVPLTMKAEGGDEGRLRHFTFGAEWSYIASFHYGIHHNFFSQEGYRVDLNQQDLGYWSNGEAHLHFGYNLNKDWNIALYAGISGVRDFNFTLPVSLRATRYFGENIRTDRFLCFIDAGSGVCIKVNPQMTASGKIGGGYRLSLSPTTKLDLIIAYRMSLVHPDVIFDGYTVPFEKINRNNAYVSSFSIGISLTL